MAMLTDFMSSAEDPRFLQSIKSHPRYHLRLTAIIAVAFGIFFNVLAIAIAQVFILSGLAFLPLCISMVWNHVDLASRRLFRKDLPAWSLVIVDALGCLSFLGLLIANGVVGSNLRYWRCGDAMLLAYTSVPWMFCCAIHGFIVVQNGSKLLESRCYSVCPNCRRTSPVKGMERSNYSRIVSEHDSDDVEAHPQSGSEAGGGAEQAPEMRESIDTTNESSCLIARDA